MLRHVASRVAWAPGLVLLASILACTGSSAPPAPTPSATESATPSATASPSTPTPISTPTPMPTPERLDIRASRLAIPSLGIEAPVQDSRIIPASTYPPTPGCPAPPPDEETFTVPNQGIATPIEAIEGLENRAWIFGHSRWLGAPGLLYALEDINLGDEVFVEGTERTTGAPVPRTRFVVDGIYLTDIESGGTLVGGDTPATPTVILQTSVREDGGGKPWILNQQKVTAKARNLVEGDVNDRCKYLLLFVFARAS